MAGGLVLGDPRDVLADVGHLAEVRVQAGVLAGAAEGLLVQVRASRRPRPRAVRPCFLMSSSIICLAERGAHELVVARDGHVLEVLAGPAGDFFHVDRAGDVAAAVAHVNADSLGHDDVLRQYASASAVSCQLSANGHQLQ